MNKVRKKRIKRFEYRHILAIIITAGFVLMSVYLYSGCFVRLKETAKDLWTSLKYYFLNLFYTESTVTATVTEKSSVDFSYVFPVDWVSFKNTLRLWFGALFDKENFGAYLYASSFDILIWYTVIVMLIVSCFAIKLLIGNAIRTPNNRYGEDTKALKSYKKLEAFFVPVKNHIKETIGFFFKTFYGKLWLFIWLYNLNVFSILGEAFAFLFYFVSSFDVANLYIQVYKLFFDVAIMLSSLPWFVWIVIAVVLLNKWRIKKAYKRLNHMESYDTGFVKSLSTVTVIYGLMGGGKGQIMTDFVLTTEKVFRADAKDIMQKYDLMFPEFPWVRFERCLRSLIAKHVIFSFATIERYIAWKRKYFEFCERNPRATRPEDALWGYDYSTYGLTFDNKLYIIDLFDALETYAKAYYVYTSPDFKVANYAIRSDGIMQDIGNLPLWDYDFFSRDSKTIDYISNYGKILDQDILRRGKKVNPSNPLSDTFEFGVIVMTELDKERGNQNVTKEMKINAEETNQKNDLFNFGLKLDRHSSTVDYTPFVKIFFDLQRVPSTNADLQECGQHIGVGDKEKGLLALPLFFIEEFIYGFTFDRFSSVYDEYRFYHGDNTLFMYIVKKLCGKFINYYRNVYNKFGYDLHRLEMENVTTGELTKHNYYLTYKKNRAKRYHTDSLVDYFRQSALKKDKGLADYPEYSGVKATREELLKQNAYFIQSLENVYNSEEKEKGNNNEERQKK